MSNNIKDFLEILISRGFIHQTTDLNDLKENFDTITGYTGFDCTATATCRKLASTHASKMVQNHQQ